VTGRTKTKEPKTVQTDPQAKRLVTPLLRWFASNARDLPWRRTRDPYAIWVSEVMLQQTQVKTVIPYFERWMRELPDVAALASTREERVLKLWEGLGYYRRARNLQRAAREIVTRHGGKFPRDFESILALPGVGRYSAGAIASIAFNQPAPILDGNVTRVLTRLFAIRRSPRLKPVQAQLWSLAAALVAHAAARRSQVSVESLPADFSITSRASALNQSLMELGALVCTPREPECGACPLETHCVARRLGVVRRIPSAAPRPATVPKRFVAIVAECDGQVFVRRRPDDGVNGGLWEFPNFALGSTRRAAWEFVAKQVLRGEVQARRPWLTVRHSITRYRIRVDAVRVAAKVNLAHDGEKWVRRGRLPELPFTAAHAKIRDALLADRD
jgi:A/G-specific adenine glycosylase